jgi:hypothetical protein
MSSDIVLKEKQELLSPNEKKAYEKYVAERNSPLSTKTAEQLFTLYMQGYGAEEIAKMNPGLDLGLIVKTKIDLNWDEKKKTAQNAALGLSKEKYQKSQLEAIEFVSNSMAVYHKMWNDKFKKYIQNGDKTELGEEWQNMSFKQYKDFAEMLLKLTGQEQNQKQQISGEIVHKMEQPQSEKSVSPHEAAQILKIIDGEFK